MGFRTLDTSGKWMVDLEPIYIPDVDTVENHNSLAAESSGRTEDGVMHLEWLRSDIITKSVKYALMTGDELDKIIQLVQGKVFNFTFPCGSDTKTITGYTAKVNATLYTEFDGILIYKDVSFNVIEL